MNRFAAFKAVVIIISMVVIETGTHDLILTSNLESSGLHNKNTCSGKVFFYFYF